MSLLRVVGTGRVSLLSLVLVGASACANNRPAASAESKEESAETANGAEAKLPPLTPIPTPEGVIARFRVTNPGALADEAFEAMSVPFDWRTAVNQSTRSFGQLNAVNWEASVEGAVVLNPSDPMNPSRFLSVGVQSVDAVLAQLEAQNIYAEEGPGGVFHFELEREPCAVGRSLGSSAARVVCSDQTAGLHHLLPYALRGFPEEKFSEAEVFFEVDARPLRTRYSKEMQRGQLLASVGARQLHVGHPKLDRAITDAAIGLAEEAGKLVRDVETWRLEVKAQEGDFQLTATLAFDGQSSTTVQSLRELASVQSAAPEMFKSIPNTAGAAYFSHELSHDLSDGWMSVVVDLVSGFAEYKGGSPAFSSHVQSLTRGLGPSGKTDVFASGPLVSTVVDGKTSLRSSWALWGSDRDRKEVETLLEDVSWLLASSEWDKIIPEIGERPTMKKVSKSVTGAKGATVYEWKLPPRVSQMVSDWEEQNSQVREVEISDAMNEFTEGFIAVHEMNGVTWVSWASKSHFASMGEAFRAVGDAGVEKIAADSRFKDVIAQPAVASGYATLVGLGGGFWSLLPQKIASEFDGLLRATPGKGEIPVTFTYRVDTTAGTKAVWDLRIPKEFSRDAATLAAMIATEMDLD